MYGECECVAIASSLKRLFQRIFLYLVGRFCVQLWWLTVLFSVHDSICLIEDIEFGFIFLCNQITLVLTPKSLTDLTRTYKNITPSTARVE